VAAAAAVLLAAGFGWGAGPAAAQENVVRIGAALPLTGGLVHEGKLQHDGYELWKDAVNEKGGISVGGKKYRVDIKYYDYKSDTPTSARLVEKLITEDGIRFIFGPFGSGATTASSAVTERYNAVLMAPSASAEEVYGRGYKYLFGILVPSSATWEDMFDLLLKQNPRPATAAIVARNDLFPLSVGNAAKASAEKRGLKVAYFEKYPVGATDFSSLLIQVKNLAPDVFVATGYTQDLILITKQARELKVNAKIMAQTAGPAYQDYTDALKDTANYVLTPVWWTPNLAWKDPLLGAAGDYAKQFQQKYKYLPDYVSAASSACGVVLQMAMEQAQSLDPPKVRDAIARSTFNTFYGPIRFGPNGQNVGTKISVVQIQNQRQEILLPAEVATGKPLYPAPTWEKR
jgi:branched-chain amino acid transport system substrate-binding protein